MEEGEQQDAMIEPPDEERRGRAVPRPDGEKGEQADHRDGRGRRRNRVRKSAPAVGAYT